MDFMGGFKISFCSNCGTENLESSNFCSRWGVTSNLELRKNTGIMYVIHTEYIKPKSLW